MFKRWMLGLFTHAELLKLIPEEALINHAADWLGEMVREASVEVQEDLVYAVTRLEDACTRFLNKAAQQR